LSNGYLWLLLEIKMRLFFILLSNLIVVFKSQADFELKSMERPEHHFPQLGEILYHLDENAPELLTDQLALEEAVLNQKIAAADKGLQVGLNLSGFSIQEDRPNRDFDQRYKAFGSVNAKKPLYHWGGLDAKENLFRIDREQAQSNLSFHKRNLTGKVRKLFLDLIVLNFRKQLAAEGQILTKQNLSDHEQRLKLGMVSPVDLAETEIELLNREIDLSELNLLINKSESDLRIISGYNEVLNFEVESSFLKFCIEHEFPQKYPVLVGSSSNRINEIESLIEKERQKVIIAESELMPKLNLVGSVYQDQVDAVSSTERVDRNNILFGIEVNWSLWDSGKSRDKKLAALVRARKYETFLAQANRKLRMMSESMRQEIHSLLERISLSRKLLKVSQNRLEKCKIEYSQKRKSPLELSTAQWELGDAKLANLEAVCNYLNALDLFEQQVGQPTSHSPISNETE